MAKKKLNKTARKTRSLIKRDSKGKMSKVDKRKHKRNLKVGDVVVSTNYRLGMKVKSKKDNRMVVVTSTKKPKAVKPIVSVTEKNKNAPNMTKISKKRNQFLKNESAVLKKFNASDLSVNCSTKFLTIFSTVASTTSLSFTLTVASAKNSFIVSRGAVFIEFLNKSSFT